MAYTYDPSQNIQQGFQQAKADVGNIFAQVIQQQQRDYNLAENAFQNIEALKKNLNIFGQKSITSKANDLLGKTSSAIMKNGKLDYSALGDIRQQVSEIGDLKQGYDVGAKEYERMLQLGIANKDNLVSFEKFYKDLSAKMGDENLVKNPQDLQKALADSYTNNLDATKIYGKGFLNANPYYKIEQDVTNPKTGALMRVQGELPRGWTIDPTTGRAIPPAPKTMVVNGQQVTMDYVDQELARIQATSPEQLVLMRKQAGVAGQNVSDKDLVKDYIDRVPMLAKSVQVKSADEIKAQGLQVDKLAFDVENQGRVLNAELNSKAASAASGFASAEASRAQAGYYKSQAEMLKGGATGSPVAMYSNTIYDPMSKKNVKYNAFPLEAETPTSITLVNGKKERAIVSDIAIGDDGQIYAKVGVRAIQGSDTKRIVKDKNNANDYQFHKIESSAVPAFLRDMKIAAGKSSDKKIKAEALSNINKIESAYGKYQEEGKNPTPAPTPKPAPSPKPTGKTQEKPFVTGSQINKNMSKLLNVEYINKKGEKVIIKNPQDARNYYIDNNIDVKINE